MDNVAQEVLLLKQEHRKTWRDRPQWYWWWRFCLEWIELSLALVKLHKDSPDWELRQLASIAINWLEMRDTRTRARAIAQKGMTDEN